MIATSYKENHVDLIISSNSESSIVDVCDAPMYCEDDDQDNNVIENCRA